MTFKEFMDGFKDNKVFVLTVLGLLALAWAVSHTL